MEKENSQRVLCKENVQTDNPKVQILIGADNNTMLINNKKVHFSKQKVCQRIPTQNHNDALHMLDYTLKRTNFSIFPPKVLNTRIRIARELLINRMRVDGILLLASRNSLKGKEIGIMDFDVTNTTHYN